MSLSRASLRALAALTVISLNLGAPFRPALADEGDAPSRPAEIELFPIPPDTHFQRHVVTPDGDDGAVAGADERVIYSNTLGAYAIRLPEPFSLVADDISTTAQHGCTLSRFTFEVTGQADPDQPAAPYSVSWAIYDMCPHYWPADREQLVVAGTEGSASFSDGAPRTIEFIPAVPVEVTTTFWLALTLSGENAGPIVGAPALEGYSSDVIDFPGSECNSDFGGFPAQPHASFNAEFFGNACDPIHLGYKRSFGGGATYRLEGDTWYVDDLTLSVDDCLMSAYVVAAQGDPTYHFELRDACTGAAIPGTGRHRVGSLAGEVRFLRFDFDPPIPIPQSIWFAARVDGRAGSGVVRAHGGVEIGWTDDSYFEERDDGACEPRQDLAFQVSITCAGPAPTGACCDMYLTDEIGDAVCREVPEVNCPFPLAGSGERPEWIEGAVCDADPFVEGICGEAACCFRDELGDEYCENLTESECFAIPPLQNERQWQRGRFCGLDDQSCPLNVCLNRPGSCSYARDCVSSPSPGCQDPDCCTTVCAQPEQGFCCDVCWDEACAHTAQLSCYFGACCDTSPGAGGACEDDVAQGACAGVFDIWTENAECSYVDCDEDVPGACCDRSPGAGGLCADAVPRRACDIRTWVEWVESAFCSELGCDEISGACCDCGGGTCTDDVLQGDCLGSDFKWHPEKMCSEVTCVEAAGPPTFSLKAVELNGSPIAPVDELWVAQGDTIETEVRVSGWGCEIPGGVRSYQVKISVLDGAVSGGNGTVIPLGWHAQLEPVECWQYPDICEPDEVCLNSKCVYPGHNPAWGVHINAARSDFLFAGMNNIHDIATSIIDYLFLALAVNETVFDTGDEAYASTLKLVVSDDACGTFTFNFFAGWDTFLGDVHNVKHFPILEPLVIHVGECVLDACVARGGDCASSHGTPGCGDPECCTSVCQDPEHDYCCSVEWDDECATFSRMVCAYGACCDGAPASGGTCEDDVLEEDCVGGYLTWHEDAGCSQIVCQRGFTPIPTTSEWGLVVMALTLLTAGKVFFGRWRYPELS